MESAKYAHLREIEWLIMDVPRDIFPQDVKYSLGAFRTLFKAKQEGLIVSLMEKWEENTL